MTDHNDYFATVNCNKRRKLSKSPNIDPAVYRYWLKLDERKQGKQNKIVGLFRCKFCDKDMVQRKERMIEHLTTCHGCDERSDTYDEAKITSIPPDFDSVTAHFPSVNESTGSTSRVQIVNISRKSKASDQPITNSLCVIPVEKMKKGQQALAKFMFSTASSFSHFDNQYWREFIEIINPAFKTPSRYQFRHSLLSTIYDDAMIHTLNSLDKAVSVTLAIDETNLGYGHKRINVIACTPHPFFLKSVNAGTTQITSSYLKNLLETLIKENHLTSKVKAIVSDNASNVKSMRQSLQREGLQIDGQLVGNVRCLSVYCLSHGVNLMLRDLMKNRLISKVVGAVTKFCHKMNRNATLIYEPYCRQKGLNHLAKFNIPPEIRWMHYLKLIDTVIPHQTAIQCMLISDFDRVRSIFSEAEFLDAMKSDNFWRDLKQIGIVIRPFCDAILEGERSQSTISDAYITMVNLKGSKANYIMYLQSKSIDVVDFSSSFEKRFDDVITDQHFVAAALDPKYRRLGMFDLENCNYIDIERKMVSVAKTLGFAEADINTMTNELLVNWLDYKEPLTIKAYDSKTESMTSEKWWLLHASTLKLSKLARVLLSIPSSSASVERSFSHLSLVKTPVRNKLEDETLGRLLKLKFDAATGSGNRNKDFAISLKEIWQDWNIPCDDVVEDSAAYDLTACEID